MFSTNQCTEYCCNWTSLLAYLSLLLMLSLYECTVICHCTLHETQDAMFDHLYDVVSRSSSQLVAALCPPRTAAGKHCCLSTSDCRHAHYAVSGSLLAEVAARTTGIATH
jgi:hypothetical protein